MLISTQVMNVLISYQCKGSFLDETIWICFWLSFWDILVHFFWLYMSQISQTHRSLVHVWQDIAPALDGKSHKGQSGAAQRDDEN